MLYSRFPDQPITPEMEHRIREYFERYGRTLGTRDRPDPTAARHCGRADCPLHRGFAPCQDLWGVWGGRCLLDLSRHFFQQPVGFPK